MHSRTRANTAPVRFPRGLLRTSISSDFLGGYSAVLLIDNYDIVLIEELL